MPINTNNSGLGTRHGNMKTFSAASVIYTDDGSEEVVFDTSGFSQIATEEPAHIAALVSPSVVKVGVRSQLVAHEDTANKTVADKKDDIQDNHSWGDDAWLIETDEVIEESFIGSEDESVEESELEISFISDCRQIASPELEENASEDEEANKNFLESVLKEQNTIRDIVEHSGKFCAIKMTDLKYRRNLAFSFSSLVKYTVVHMRKLREVREELAEDFAKAHGYFYDNNIPYFCAALWGISERYTGQTSKKSKALALEIMKSFYSNMQDEAALIDQLKDIHEKIKTLEEARANLEQFNKLGQGENGQLSELKNEFDSIMWDIYLQTKCGECEREINLKNDQIIQDIMIYIESSVNENNFIDFSTNISDLINRIETICAGNDAIKLTKDLKTMRDKLPEYQLSFFYKQLESALTFTEKECNSAQDNESQGEQLADVSTFIESESELTQDDEFQDKQLDDVSTSAKNRSTLEQDEEFQAYKTQVLELCKKNQLAEFIYAMSKLQVMLDDRGYNSFSVESILSVIMQKFNGPVALFERGKQVTREVENIMSELDSAQNEVEKICRHFQLVIQGVYQNLVDEKERLEQQEYLIDKIIAEITLADSSNRFNGEFYIQKLVAMAEESKESADDFIAQANQINAIDKESEEKKEKLFVSAIDARHQEKALLSVNNWLHSEGIMAEFKCVQSLEMTITRLNSEEQNQAIFKMSSDLNKRAQQLSASADQLMDAHGNKRRSVDDFSVELTKTLSMRGQVRNYKQVAQQLKLQGNQPIVATLQEQKNLKVKQILQQLHQHKKSLQRRGKAIQRRLDGHDQDSKLAVLDNSPGIFRQFFAWISASFVEFVCDLRDKLTTGSDCTYEKSNHYVVDRPRLPDLITGLQSVTRTSARPVYPDISPRMCGREVRHVDLRNSINTFPYDIGRINHTPICSPCR